MSESTVAIAGSGIVKTTIAYQLTKKGFVVDIFEKGPSYPYPHTEQFSEQTFYLYDNPRYRLSKELKNLKLSGDYRDNLDGERFMIVDRWTGQCHQFLDPPTRGKHGGIKVEFSSRIAYKAEFAPALKQWTPELELIEELQPMLHWRPIKISAESISTPQNRVTLSQEKDRLGVALLVVGVLLILHLLW